MKELQSYLDRLNRINGPFVIIGRGHSGTSFLAEIFIKNNIFMGDNLKPVTSDSLSFRFKFIQPLINSKYFPHWEKYLSDIEFQEFCNKLLLDTLQDFIQTDFEQKNWGWKLGSSCFIVPVIKTLFPSAKFVHIIRDGRDVILSQNGIHNIPFLRYKYKNPIKRLRDIFTDWADSDNYELNKTFNTSEIKKWNGIDLDSKNVFKIKYQLGILSWINCIETARKYGKNVQNDFYEIRYEELCNNPEYEIKKLFNWLNINLYTEAEEYAKTHASTRSIAKWKKLKLTNGDNNDFQKAVKLGSSLLMELAYTID